jgi:hypothetical protein
MYKYNNQQHLSFYMLIFLIHIDKEKLNGLYNEIVNKLIDDIDKDKVNSFVSELCVLFLGFSDILFQRFCSFYF